MCFGRVLRPNIDMSQIFFAAVSQKKKGSPTASVCIICHTGWFSTRPRFLLVLFITMIHQEKLHSGVWVVISHGYDILKISLFVIYFFWKTCSAAMRQCLFLTFSLLWNHCFSFTLSPPAVHGLLISAYCRVLGFPFRKKNHYELFHLNIGQIFWGGGGYISSYLIILRLCPRCSSGYVCPTGMRMLLSGSYCDWGERSVRGGGTGSTVHLSRHPYPPHCSGPTGRPLHDGRLARYAMALVR